MFVLLPDWSYWDHDTQCLVEGYVADEIITSAAGTRVRVGNTDAEGRMAMADAIHHMKQRVTSALFLQIFFMFILSTFQHKTTKSVYFM